MENNRDARVLGLLPARAGSKGLPGKNLAKIGGKSALAWSAAAILNSSQISTAICSTDSEEIAQEAQRAGLSVPFLRPKTLAGDQTLVMDVVLHALSRMSEEQPVAFDYVALVQATSPTVTPGDVDEAVRMAIAGNFDTVVSAYKAPPSLHPAMAFFGAYPNVEGWALGHKTANSRRQDLPTAYIRAGLVYVFKTQTLDANSGFYSGRTGFIEVESCRAISIDTSDDLELARRSLAGPRNMARS